MSNLESTSPINPDATLEHEISREANRIIDAACIKHGVDRSQIKPEYIKDAEDFARTKVIEDRERRADPVYQQLLEEREAHRLTQLQLQAVKSSRTSSGNERVSVTEANTVRAQLGNGTWFQMTLDQRLAAIGVDPKSVTATTKQEIKDLFGKGASSQLASDSIRQNEKRYKQLREIGRVLDLIGK